MNFFSLYRLSFYVMIVFATHVLSGDSTDNKWALLYPVATAIVGIFAFLTVDRRSAPLVPDWMFNSLATVSIALTFLEYVNDPTLLLLSLGHWLVYLQLILMLRPKTVKIDWELFGLSLAQVLVGAVINQTDQVGLVLFCWAVLALWVLGLFSLRREAFRARGGDGTSPLTDAEDYPGLLNISFLLSAFRVTLTTLALGALIFLAMPRKIAVASKRLMEQTGQHITGFDEEVKLGQMGEILENDNVVMSVELFDDQGARIHLADEPLWRGVTMTDYHKGRWSRQRKTYLTFPNPTARLPSSGSGNRNRGIIRQQIKLEPNDSNVLFGMRPMLDATTGSRVGPVLSSIDGTISRSGSLNGTLDYEVRSFQDEEIPQPGERAPGLVLKNRLLGVPDDVRPRLTEIAREVIAKALPPEQRDNVPAQARALEAYLKTSGKFSYTLKLDRIDPNLDPVEDFLVNRQEGHCEYFASALTLLLRSVDIPARMVNGFKGGDWSELAMVLIVRQKHAHSWVEAYLGEEPGPERRPRWLTLDPTPSAERNLSVARVGGFKGNFRPILDVVRYIWVFYILGYDADRQNKLMYAPIRALVAKAREGFGLMGEGIQKNLKRMKKLFHFSDVQAFISIRGFLVSFLTLTLVAGLFRGTFWVVTFFLRWFRGQNETFDAHSIGAAQYRRLTLLLRDYGLDRPPTETQHEFARRATQFLTSRGSNTQAVAEVPCQVVDAFYRVRFGHFDINENSILHLETSLDALEASLLASQA
ncbi:MAG: transglutaminaseTgpA domain-containing protein [Isosphaeraceae bacterium]